MTDDTVLPTTPRSRRVSIGIGRAMSLLVAALFLFSASMKFVGGEELDKAMTHLGLPNSMVIPLAILEVTCAVVYLLPPTAVLGAILLTGYLGGAICTHWRVGDLFALHIVIGIVIWLALALREPRLFRLIFWRLRNEPT